MSRILDIREWHCYDQIMKLFFSLLMIISVNTEAAPARQTIEHKILSQLLAIPSTSLVKLKNCNVHTDVLKTPTLGEWISWNLSFFEPGKANGIEASCKVIKKQKQCQVEFFADSKSDSPWSCGLRFNMDSKTDSLVPSTIECIGPC